MLSTSFCSESRLSRWRRCRAPAEKRSTTDCAGRRAPGKNTGQGAAYVFVRSGTTWTQQQKLTALDGAAGDFFGTSVAVGGNTVVVGAPGISDPNAAYVFRGPALVPDFTIAKSHLGTFTQGGGHYNIVVINTGRDLPTGRL